MKPHILLINEEDHENVHHPEIVEINDEVGIDMTIADELAPDHLVVGTEVSIVKSFDKKKNLSINNNESF